MEKYITIIDEFKEAMATLTTMEMIGIIGAAILITSLVNWTFSKERA